MTDGPLSEVSLSDGPLSEVSLCDVLPAGGIIHLSLGVANTVAHF